MISSLLPAIRHDIALRSHLVIHDVARLKKVRMRQAVGSPVMMIALSARWNVAVNHMYRLGPSIDEYLVNKA